MTQEEKQLLLQAICEGIPHGVKAQVTGWDEEKGEEVTLFLKIYSVNTDGYVSFENNDYEVDTCYVDQIRLCLRKKDSMTTEDYKEYDSHRRHVSDEYNRYCFDCDESIDWLNENHFDHRDLIPNGMAIEAPKDMYKLN